jgi:hypothetical protein
MASDLTPTEKEERQVERLINKEPAPSRKPAERRGPKHDNRRDRMTVDDPDINNVDPDLSLNYKSSSLADIALLIMFRQVAADDPPKTQRSPEAPKEAPKLKVPRPGPKKEPAPKASPPIPETKKSIPKTAPPKVVPPKEPKKIPKRLRTTVNRFEEKLREASPAVANAFRLHAESTYLKDTTNIDSNIDKLDKMDRTLTSQSRTLGRQFLTSGNLSDLLVQSWPKDKEDWVGRGAVIGGLQEAVDSIPIPAAFKAPFERLTPGDIIKDRELIQKVVESTAGGPTTHDIKEGVVVRFAQLMAALKILSKNPASIEKSTLSKGMKELSKVVSEQAHQLLELGSIMDDWHKAIADLKPGMPSDKAPGKDLNRVLHSLESYLSPSKKPVVDPTTYVDELEKYLKKKYGEVPKQVAPLFKGFKRAATSNDSNSDRIMAANRQATYHGVKIQGHPEGTSNTPYLSYDKRYFGEEHFKSILKFAKELMEEDWLKYEWEGGAKDAPFRAALDLSIHLADGSLYQSKIDSETYDMLLNRLAGWDWDTFSETVLPTRSSKASRSAAKMNQPQPAFKNPHVAKIMRIASDLRATDPGAALEIIKNLRSLVSSDATPAPDMSTHVAQEQQEQEQEGRTSQQMLNAQQQQEQQAQQQEQGQQQMISQQEQQATDPDMLDFKSMGPEDFEKLKVEAKKQLFEAKDIEQFMKGLDKIMEEVGGHTASARISLSTLIRIAAALPASRKVLLPVIIAAKKKSDKKKQKKTSQPKKEEAKPKDDKTAKPKKPPFGGKKAPPFGGKKAPPFGKKKKASVEIETSDLDW